MSEGRKTTKKGKVTWEDLQLLPDPVWEEKDGHLQPTPFFRDWWERVAQQKFGDRAKWPEAVHELRYVATYYNGSGLCTDPVGFDYDPKLYRESLGLPADMPLVSRDGNPDAYQRLWGRLLGEGNDG